jgi:hypothetical protein
MLLARSSYGLRDGHDRHPSVVSVNQPALPHISSLIGRGRRPKPSASASPMTRRTAAEAWSIGRWWRGRGAPMAERLRGGAVSVSPRRASAAVKRAAMSTSPSGRAAPGGGAVSVSPSRASAARGQRCPYRPNMANRQAGRSVVSPYRTNRSAAAAVPARSPQSSHLFARHLRSVIGRGRRLKRR